MSSSSQEPKLRVLTFTSLYPNSMMPQHGVFVENRLRQLLASGEVSARVVAPVPYFPFSHQWFGRYSLLARVPNSETRHGIELDHPRFVAIPKVGMNVGPLLLYAGARQAVMRLIRAGHVFDLIDAHYFYPDGVAAAMLARFFGLPFVITGRGTDLNVLPDYAGPRAMIRWAARQADALITVSSALAEKLVALGISQSKTTVLRNGVDGDVFRPTAPYKHEGSTPAPLAISVGNLVPSKGHDLAISALQHIQGLHLWIVGGGPDRGRLEALSHGLNLRDRVRFLGAIPPERMPEVYSAADILILASAREGWPNVVLEAMACGVRVVATNISDVSTILHEPVAGTCLAVRSVEAVVEGVRKVMAATVPREATRAHALNFGWQATTRGQIDLFRAIRARHSGEKACQSYPHP